MPSWPEITPVIAIIAGPVMGGIVSAVIAWLTLRGRRAEEDTKLAAVRAEQSTKLAGIQDAALARTFEIVERSRDDVFAQLAGERARREALETRVTDLSMQQVKAMGEMSAKLAQSETELRILRELQCPLAVTGACPVFRTRGVIVPS